MSILLPAIDLSSAVVNQKVHIPLFQQGLPSTFEMGTLQMHNDSGVGLNIVTDTAADQIFLSAGQWREIKVSPGESGFTYQVVYVLQNPPVSTLSLVYYYPGETVNDLGALGNSPIGGSVAASNAISVTNTGFPGFNVFIFAQAAGDTDNLGSVSINNAGQEVLGDHFYSGFLSIRELTNNNRSLLIWNGADSSTLDFNPTGMNEVNASGVFVFKLDANGNITCANGQTIITFGAGNQTQIENTQGSDIVFLSGNPTPAEIGRFTNAGTTKSTNFNSTTAGTQISGGTSGTATLFEDCIGNVKRFIVLLSNFRTGASAQNIALPTAFTNGGLIRTGAMGTSATAAGFSLLKSGVAQNMQVFTSLATTGTSGTTVTQMFGGSIGEIQTGFDTIQFEASGTAAHTSWIEVTGQ